MDILKAILFQIDAKKDSFFLLFCFFFYYLSIKKCFWKPGKSRIGLLGLTLLGFPYTVYFITFCAVSLPLSAVQKSGLISRLGFIMITMPVITVLYIVVIFLLSDLIGKWLKVPDRRLVTFVSLMYSTVISTFFKSPLDTGGDDWVFAVAANIIGWFFALCLAVVLLYFFVIRALSKLTVKEQAVNSKLFTVPMVIFTFLYNNFSLIVLYISEEESFGNVERFFIIQFSNIILFFFIWAFYVIIMNINATNEALEAKDAAAEMAAEEARIEADLSIAKSIQLSALPYTFPPFPERKDFELFASMNAAKEVGGDFYDFYMLEQDKLGFLIADVSGKGIPAAMFMMKGKTIIRDLAENGRSPGEVFNTANEKLCEGNDAELFITAWMGFLDLKTGTVHVANAGHNPPVLIRDGRAEYVVLKPGLMLAGMDGMTYKDQTLQLQKGDILYLYTDGVTEAMDEDEDQYGEDRLIKLLSFGENCPEPSGDNGIAGAVCGLVKADVDSFVKDAEQSDDITMLCIRYLGGS